MKPGRELDALIAEKVMGWSVQHNKDADGEDYWDVLNPDGEIVDVNRLSHEAALLECDRLPNYSTDIAAAWEVVEKIKANKPSPSEYGLKETHPQEFQIKYFEGKWLCGWYPRGLDGNATIEIEAETAPHAICLAAFKAVGEK